MNSADDTAIVRSYAKVNLTLDVLGKRPDGFHSIESVMQSISLHDTLTLGLGDEPGIRVACDVPGIPTGEDNLAYQAASLLFERLGVAPGLDIRIEKHIPCEAGLGGGSSNAAAVLRGLNQLLGSAVADQAELGDLAARIGSDVPFFLVGGTAFVRGRGEDVQPLPDIRPRWLVIAKPSFGVFTAWAYRRLDEIRVAEQYYYSRGMLECVENENCERLPQLLGNDLEIPALDRYGEIAAIKETLIGAGACGALMCGSGSAVFGLFAGEDEARQAADRLARSEVELFVAKTISRGEALDGSTGE